MGQGYSINVSAGSAGIDVPELADLEPERTLGAVRFMKTIRARHKDGLVIAKVFIKPYPNLKLDKQIKRMLEERRDLAEVPNALAYHRILETPTNGYLARQYIHSSLYDRISTNPSLEEIEKKWITYQLLCAVRDCHARDIYHGDIKTENMLVTTWNWLYLTDFSASFKPAHLPEDNPATFSMYFDTTGRRICYVAPERFVKSAELKELETVDKMGKEEREDYERYHKLTWTMDIFSVGCVIAELFTEKPTFTLSQLFKYRKGEYDPNHTTLNSIKDDQIREMVGHMIQLEPDQRFTAAEYLHFYEEKVFPKYFGTFLHQYMHVITDPTSGRTPVTAGKKNSGGSDDRIERIYSDFDSISVSLGFTPQETHHNNATESKISAGLDLFPLQIDLPGDRHKAADRSTPKSDNGALLFLNVVIASLRSTARASSRVKACELLLALSERLTDEAKLDRVLPFAIALLEDESDNVRIAALRTITQLLSIVTVLSPMNVFVFPNYVLLRLQKFIQHSSFKRSAPLRATYATCLASLATTASRFLDMMQALRADGSLPSTDPEAEDDVAMNAAYQESYDSTREDLIRHFEAQTKIFLVDEDPSVRRAFLGSVTSLCVFFGDSLAADLILTHLNTYLNDEDWELKCAFFEAVVGIAAFIGGRNLEDFILPLMVQALSDPEETVTEQVIRSLSSMAKLGLFQRWTIVELVIMVVRFTFHPNTWIREAAVQFIEAATTHLDDADSWSMIMPLVRPVLKIPSAELTELGLLDALKKPFPRTALEMARTWAEKVDKGVFWRPAQQNKSFSFENASGKALRDFYQDLHARGLSKAGKNEEDDQWLSKMRMAGMRTEDEAKLLALRDYIWRLMLRSDRDSSASPVSPYNQIVSLAGLKVPLQNVMFDEEFEHDASTPASQPSKAERKNIEEALKEAATPATINKPGSAGAFAAARQNMRSATFPQAAPAINTPLRTDHHDQNSDHMSIDDAVMNHRRTMTTIDKPGLRNASPTSLLSPTSPDNNHGLRRKNSAMALTKRVDTTKATAEIGTDSINAIGRVETPSHNNNSQPSSRPISRSDAPPLKRAPASHNYKGGDPNVLKLLDNHYTTNVSQDSDFGKKVPATKRSLGNPTPWKPQGLLVAVLGDHSGQINCIATAPDHAFFITGSDDSTVRVWDTARFERNVTHRPRQIHKHAPGIRVTSLAFIEQTHSFVTTGSDGSVQVVKVELDPGNGMPRYSKLQVLRDWKIPSCDNTRTEHAVAVEHSRADGQSIIMILTNLCRVLAVNSQTMSIIYSLQNPVEHGAPTTFCIQKRRQWLVIGTAHGVLDLWDLRFHLRLRSWTTRNPSPVTHITLHPGRRTNQKQKICVAGFTDPGHVSIWDLEKAICTELYHVVSTDLPASSSSRLRTADFELLNVDEERSSGAAATSARILGAVSLDPNLNPSTLANDSKTEVGQGSVRSFQVSMHIPPDGADPRYSYLVSAGPDWKVRFWDTAKLESSCVVNGDEPKPTQRKDDVTQNQKDDSTPPAWSASTLGTDTKVYTARDTLALPALSSKIKSKESPDQSPSPSRIASSPSTTGANGSPNKKKKGEGKVSRYETIRASAQQLLRGHRDAVTAVAVVERPFGMIVSGDRSGGVYVFM